jgi:glycosyltransferase involved in cell wall biosynthesis
MKLLILHHHLQRGGVTRIIDSQIESLKKFLPPENITVLTGQASEEIYRKGVKVKIDEKINYLTREAISPEKARGLFTAIKKTFLKLLNEDTIIHAHNLNLGKNPVLTAVVAELARDGVPLFNHCHDFAEDGRENNMAFIKEVVTTLGQNTNEVLYPDIRNYFYGVLNSRDSDFLKKKNIPEKRVFFIPNPVHIPSVPEISRKKAREALNQAIPLDPALPIYVYPVRVIRRKNIGEFILFAALFPEKANWAVTLKPQNPIEKKEYDAWLKFRGEKNIKIHFEIGHKVDFPVLMRAADKCVITSVKEGFGMAFLEPWLFDVPVAGRNIPYVTADFKKHGLDLSSLYNTIMIGENDFSTLTPERQRSFIEKIMASPEERKNFIARNPQMNKLFAQTTENVIKHNIKIIKENYSLQNYGEKLYGIYKKMPGQPL